MRELDLLLEKFLASDFDALSEQELAAMEHLLNQADQDILAWISVYRSPPPELAGIVSRIRRCVDS